MPVTFRLPHLTGALLLAAAPFAGAQSLPDPIAPAVIGRPLDQIGPVRPARPKPAVAKPKPTPAAQLAAPANPVTPVATQRAPKQAIDDRADTRTQVADDVGQGTRFARKPLGTGAYFSSRHQALVREYYAANPPAKAANWKVGEPVPAQATLSGVPDELRARLPALPPGHQYLRADGEVLLVAVQSRMVVDGVSRSLR